MKACITISVLIFSTLGGFAGGTNPLAFNALSLIGNTLGGFLGIYIGYKIGKYFDL